MPADRRPGRQVHPAWLDRLRLAMLSPDTADAVADGQQDRGRATPASADERASDQVVQLASISSGNAVIQ
jgi:hypothetical protein